MAWVKIEDGVVVQKQTKEAEGFVKVDDFVICGMVQTEDGFEVPPKVEPPEQISEKRILELKQLLKDSDYVALVDYDKKKPELIKQRQVWREELRKLEG